MNKIAPLLVIMILAGSATLANATPTILGRNVYDAFSPTYGAGSFWICSRVTNSAGSIPVATLNMYVQAGAVGTDSYMWLGVWDDDGGSSFAGTLLDHTDMITIPPGFAGWTGNITTVHHATLSNGNYYVGAYMEIHVSDFHPHVATVNWDVLHKDNIGGPIGAFPYPPGQWQNTLDCYAVLQAPLVLTPTHGVNGDISPDTAQSVSAGGSQTFSFIPNSGFRVLAVTIDGTPVSPVPTASYTFTNVQADHTIVVSFEAIPPTYLVTTNLIFLILAIVGYLVYRHWWK